MGNQSVAVVDDPELFKFLLVLATTPRTPREFGDWLYALDLLCADSRWLSEETDLHAQPISFTQYPSFSLPYPFILYAIGQQICALICDSEKHNNFCLKHDVCVS